MPAIHSIDGPLRLDPGKAGRAVTFGFVNVSPWPICDLRITTWDDDAFGASPDILPDGFRMTTFDPRSLPGNRIGVQNEQAIPKDDFDRSNDEEEAEETVVTFKPGKCIQPGKGFALNLTFDETLDGNEGIEVSPSRLLNGEHYSIGATVVERPGPFTWTDLLEALGKIGGSLPTGALLGQRGGEDERTGRLLASAMLSREFSNTRVRELHHLPIRAVSQLDERKASALEELGFHRIRDLAEDHDVQRLMTLYRIARPNRKF